MRDDEEAIARIANSLAAVETYIHRNGHSNGNDKDKGDKLIWTLLGVVALLASAFGSTLYFNMRAVDERQDKEARQVWELIYTGAKAQAIKDTEQEFLLKELRQRIEQLEAGRR